MSKRFGRNQRRQLREEVAAWRLLSNRHCARADEDRKRADSLQRRIEEWARNIVTLLGTDHPLNERIREMRVRVPGDGIYRMHDRVPLPSFLSLSEPMAFESSYITALCHRLHIERDVDGIPRVVLKLTSPKSDSVYYAIDEAELQAGRRDPRFAEWLADRIQRELVRLDAERRAA